MGNSFKEEDTNRTKDSKKRMNNRMGALIVRSLNWSGKELKKTLAGVILSEKNGLPFSVMVSTA